MDNFLGYTAEFKYKVVLEVLEEKNSIIKIAKKYKIEPFLIRSWKIKLVDIMKETLIEKNDMIKSIENKYNRQLLLLTKKMQWLENRNGVEKYGKKKTLS